MSWPFQVAWWRLGLYGLYCKPTGRVANWHWQLVTFCRATWHWQCATFCRKMACIGSSHWSKTASGLTLKIHHLVCCGVYSGVSQYSIGLMKDKVRNASSITAEAKHAHSSHFKSSHSPTLVWHPHHPCLIVQLESCRRLHDS